MDLSVPAVEALCRNASVWGFDAMWQTPASTEEHAFRRCWETMPPTPGAIYVGFPWATLIDHLQTKSERGARLEAALQRFSHALREAVPAGRVVTVCQHILALRFLHLYKQLGVTDIFWSHAEHATREVDGIAIHAFPLYPAVTADRVRQEPGLAPQERPYLYSFTGAYDARYYRTASREWIGRLPTEVDGRSALVEVWQEWHFQKAVYDVQVRGLALSESDRQAMRQRERRYVDLLRRTVFSLCPSGSGPNTIRVWESLALGAVPVILADGLRLPGDPMLWQQAAVFVRETPDAVATVPQMLARLAARPGWLEDKRRAGAMLYERYGPGDFIHDVRALMVNAPPVPTVAAAPEVIVLDPGLKDTKSHHHVLNTHLQRRSEVESFSLRVVGHASARPQDFPYRVQPQFRWSVYDDTAALPAADYQDQVLAHCTDLQRVLAQAPDRCAIVIHTATAAFLQGLALALTGAARPVRAVVVELMFHPLSFLKAGQAPQRPFARYLNALRMLKRYEAQCGVPVHLSTSCGEFASSFEPLVGERVPIHPYALLAAGADGPRTVQSAPAGGPPRVLLFAGDLKLDKGVGWVAEALPSLLEAHPDLHFVVHLGDNRFGDARLRDIQRDVGALAQRFRNLEVLPGYLGEAAWDAVMGSLDVCLIPYDPRSYGYKTSGVFWEFLRKAGPAANLVVTRGTWMEREATALGLPVAVCQFGDTASLTAALRAVRTTRTSVAASEPSSRRTAALQFFGQGNDEYIFSLLAAACIGEPWL